MELYSFNIPLPFPPLLSFMGFKAHGTDASEHLLSQKEEHFPGYATKEIKKEQKSLSKNSRNTLI